MLNDPDERGHRRMGARLRAMRGALAAALALMVAAGTGCSAAGSEGPSMAVTEVEGSQDDERATGDGTAADVVDVVDGDTFDVLLADGAVERVRSPQIDAPEIGECGYGEASAVLEELISGREVLLVPTEHGPDRDDYERLLRAAEVDSHDVGEVLLRRGFARWVPHFADEDPRLAEIYEAAENEARARSAGSWGECHWS